ncbi:MAG: hypothetical protein J0L61_08125, partial [Planctomycetes bacterium]|nr:hypothetical protein [Planctomycetota bacterium]
MFLCTGNCCRSQMAEGWAKALKPDSIDACSAGTHPHGLNPLAVRAMAEAAGLSVSVYTSPHLVRFNERIRVAGRLIDDADLEPILDRLEAVDAEISATVFEMTTAAAFLAMAETPADLAVVEVGLGGLLDATNVIARPRLSVITPVDL